MDDVTRIAACLPAPYTYSCIPYMNIAEHISNDTPHRINNTIYTDAVVLLCSLFRTNITRLQNAKTQEQQPTNVQC